jgi:hypothetical protein
MREWERIMDELLRLLRANALESPKNLARMLNSGRLGSRLHILQMGLGDGDTGGMSTPT